MAHEQHPADKNDSSGGSMDISYHVKTWHAFWNGAKWSVVGLVILAALLFIFRTHNG